MKKSDRKTAVEKKIKCLREHAGSLLRAQRSRAANYDSSGMSPELSAKRGIKKRAVSGPTASQSDSHVNNIDGICCNLGITLPTPQPQKGNLKTCPLKVKNAKKRPVLATVRALCGEPEQAHALPAWLPVPGSENHYSTICLS